MKTISKLLVLTLAVVMMLAVFSSCGAKGKTLDEVKAAGKLVVATSPDFPPFENLENGQVVGIEVEIMQAICDKLGVKMELAQMDFESVLPGIKAGKFDVGMSGITVNEKRQKNALFTNPYCLAAQAIVVVEGSDIKTKADLSGKAVSVQSGTTAESFCGENGYDVKSFAANSDAETALTTGKVAAWVIDDLTAKEMVDEYNKTAEKKLVILPEAMTTEPYAFAFTFGSEDLVAEINKIQAEMLADGTIKAIFEKYDAPYTAPDAN